MPRHRLVRKYLSKPAGFLARLRKALEHIKVYTEGLYVPIALCYYAYSVLVIILTFYFPGDGVSGAGHLPPAHAAYNA